VLQHQGLHLRLVLQSTLTQLHTLQLVRVIPAWSAQDMPRGTW
jgi:hypothetical protein